MEQILSGSEASGSGVASYPKDLDITVYDDGRWRYAASLPDDEGSFREVFLHPVDGGSWGMRLHEHFGSDEFQGETTPRWKDGFEVNDLGSGFMSYDMARGAAEVWLRGGRIHTVA